MNTMQVETEEFESPDGLLKVTGAKPGTWRIIDMGRSKMYLHNNLSVEVAASLAIWEEQANANGSVKVTRDAEHDVVGIAIRR